MIGISRAAAEKEQGHSERVEMLLSILDGSAVKTTRGELPFPSANVLCDLADALRDLDRGDRRRVAVRVRLADEPCEIGLERAGNHVLLSLYSGGALPVVHVFERPLLGAEVAARIASELGEREKRGGTREAERVAAARSSLEPCVFGADASLRPVSGRLLREQVANDEADLVVIEPLEDLQLSLSGEITLRAPAPSKESSSPAVLRADLLGLLARGRLRITAFESSRELVDVHVFLVAEQLARLAIEALEAISTGRALWRKVKVGGAVCGMRVVGREGNEARLALTLGYATGRSDSWTFPALDIGLFARAVVDFGRGLARAIVRRDRSQTHNLRLVEFRSMLREIGEMTREVDRNDTVINISPESYRAYARPDVGRESAAPMSNGRVRFSPKWTAAVPAIDLRSTFQCGDAFVVGSLRELSCIDRHTGRIVWNRGVSKGVSVLTPCGIARFDIEGLLSVLDLGSGETRTKIRLAPRVGAPVTGAVVSGAGLPRMLIISEGRRHLAGVDLEAGEVLWRYAARRAGPLRLKRAGRLVIVSSGEQALTAIDVVGGNVVWRHCDRLRFGQTATVADDSLFALAGAVSGVGEARLCHLDLWSGAPRFSVPLGEPARLIGPPLVARDNVLIASLGSRGTRIAAFDKKTGERVFARDVCLGVASPMVVDDVVILNSESGELVAIDANDGSLRYRHVFSEGLDGDRPRRLEPVLRSGALFVPQTAVHVVRPSDGALLGAIQTDIIPDLLRVDERCDVYAAEESGHVVAFSAAARLTLVK
jgi:outer membrane protein assembly factor BamB